jgi:hypothetical protein
MNCLGVGKPKLIGFLLKKMHFMSALLTDERKKTWMPLYVPRPHSVCRSARTSTDTGGQRACT